MNTHAAEQFKKRYGLVVNERKLLQKIRDGVGVIRRMHTANSDRWIYDVDFDGSPLRLVTNAAATAIITALPDEFQLKKRQDGQRKARKSAPRVDEVEEAYALISEAQAEDRAIGLELEECKAAEKFMRESLITALLRIAELEKKIDALK